METPKKRKPKKKHQDTTITIRLSSEALERIRHNAEIDRKNISKYLRDCFDQIPTKDDVKEENHD